MSRRRKHLKILFQHLDDDDNSHARIANTSCIHKSCCERTVLIPKYMRLYRYSNFLYCYYMTTVVFTQGYTFLYIFHEKFALMFYTQGVKLKGETHLTNLFSRSIIYSLVRIFQKSSLLKVISSRQKENLLSLFISLYDTLHL